jgi:glycosyltransferase involved in cell wall biosynthesis
MRVFLNIGKHPIYTELLEFPPKDVSYISPIRAEEKPRHYSSLNNFKRRALMLIAAALKSPRMMRLGTNADLIHSTRGLLVLNDKPWVIDVEHASSFVSFNHKQLSSETTQKIIKRLLESNNCKKILPHSEFSRRSIEAAIDCSKLKDKIEVLYPAIRPCNIKKSGSKIFRMSFAGHHFLEKGGLEVLQAYKQLKKRHHVKLTVKTTDAPQELISKYSDVNWIVNKTLTREELFRELYVNADVFVLPSYIDTFGMVVLESMSAGTPVITTDIAAFPEIVDDGKSGFLVKSNLSCWNSLGTYANDKNFKDKLKLDKPEIVSQLVEKLEMLIKNPKIRQRMGRNAKKEVIEGKFSIKTRNQKLSNVYKEALNG